MNGKNRGMAMTSSKYYDKCAHCGLYRLLQTKTECLCSTCSKKFDMQNNPDYAYTYIKELAEKRGVEFKLTKAQVEAMINSDCYYCGLKDPSGIDRVDNTVGYTKDNCVSCCAMCNMLKGRYTKDEFINKCIWIADLATKRIMNKYKLEK